MSGPERRKARIEDGATTAEVMAAIDSLSAEQYYRLKGFARFRIRGLGRAAMGRTYDSLLSEAVLSTLQGAEGGTNGRRWAKKRVPFVDHLFGAIRSISDHWLKAYQRRGTDAERFDCETASEGETGNLVRPTEQAVDPASDSFRSYAAIEMLDLLDKHFSQDHDALLVIEARKEEMTVPEMVAGLGLTEKEVNAALQRIRYFMKRFQ